MIEAILLFAVLMAASVGIDYAFGKGDEPAEPVISNTSIFLAENGSPLYS